MSHHEQLGRVFVELADTLVNDFDVPDFLYNLTVRAVELLEVDAAGLLLADQRGALMLMAAIGLLQERSLREQSTRNRQLQLALDSRTVIEQAKGLLAGMTGVPLGEASATMRSYSRAHNRKISAVAQEVVTGFLDVNTLRQR